MPVADMLGGHKVGAAESARQIGKARSRRMSFQPVSRAKRPASGPYLVDVRRRETAISIYPHEIRTQPGSFPFGPGAFHQKRKRSGEYTISGAAVPLTQMHPFG
jgi:hypothetical protein